MKRWIKPLALSVVTAIVEVILLRVLHRADDILFGVVLFALLFLLIVMPSVIAVSRTEGARESARPR